MAISFSMENASHWIRTADLSFHTFLIRCLPPALYGDAAIAVEFDLKGPLPPGGSIVTDLHCIGSMNAGSAGF